MSYELDDELPPTIGEFARDWRNCWAMAKNELPDSTKDEQLEIALATYFNSIKDRYGADPGVIKTCMQAIYVSGTHEHPTMRAAVDKLFSKKNEPIEHKSRMWRLWVSGSLVWATAILFLSVIFSDGGSDEVGRWLAVAFGLPTVSALAIIMFRWARK